MGIPFSALAKDADEWLHYTRAGLLLRETLVIAESGTRQPLNRRKGRYRDRVTGLAERG
jgi:hypothetical protein